jgi:hypothetical protein
MNRWEKEKRGKLLNSWSKNATREHEEMGLSWIEGQRVR